VPPIERLPLSDKSFSFADPPGANTGHFPAAEAARELQSTLFSEPSFRGILIWPMAIDCTFLWGDASDEDGGFARQN